MKNFFLILVSFVITSVFVMDIHAQDKTADQNKIAIKRYLVERTFQNILTIIISPRCGV